MKKAISSALAAALIILSPGLSCYEAAAASFGNRSTRAGGRATNLNKIAVQQAAVWNKRTHQIAIKATSLNLAAAAAPSQAAASYVWSGAPRAAAARSARSIGEATMAVASLQKRVSTDNLSISGAGVSGVLGHFGRFYDNFKARALSADPVQGGESSDKGGLSRPASSQSSRENADLSVPAPQSQDEAGKAPSKIKVILAAVKNRWDNIQALPPSFRRNYVAGWTLNAVGQEIQAVGLPLYSGVVFGPEMALMINQAGYLVRIAGAWMGAYFMNRFHPNAVNMAALVSVALAGASVAFVGVKSPLLLPLLLANAVVGGIAYGVTRGIAEGILPKMILGSLAADAPEEAKAAKKDALNLGLNWAYFWVEAGAIFAAFWLAEPLLKRVGGSWMMAISSGLTGLAALFYALIKFNDQWTRPDASKASAAKSQENQTAAKGGWKEYLPLIYARYNHFLLYGVAAVVLGLSIFPGIKMQLLPMTPPTGATGATIGIYDLGSLVLSLMASFALIPKSLGPMPLAVMMVAASSAFLWSAVLGAPLWAVLSLAGLLGGVITINTNEWMSRAQQNLPQQKLNNLSKWVMTWSILAMLPLTAVLSAVKISPAMATAVSMPMILGGTAAFVTAAGLAMLWLIRGGANTAPTK